MKKGIFVAMTVCAAACSFALAACGGSGEYDTLNEMLSADYSQIVLTVTDIFDEDTSLTSEYIITYSPNVITVNYTVEKFASLSLENPSAGMKTTLTGEASIKNGLVISVDGDDIGLAPDIVKTGLTFNEKYFENAVLTGVIFKADVKDASAFFGTDLVCSDMKVVATYFDVFSSIEISYLSEAGNAVTYHYTFNV